MAQFDYSELLKALLKATNENKIIWEREIVSKYQFYCKDANQRKLLMDKYYALNDKEQIACINMTIFNTDSTIIDEMVLCTTSPEREEYSLLETLYNTVSELFAEREMNFASPILSQITESFQKLAAS